MAIGRKRLCVLFVALIAGCTSDSDRPAPSGLLGVVPLDTVVLEESDTLYLGKPDAGLFVDDRGAIYVADEFWRRLVRFTREGHPDRVFGQNGSGPGEFRSTAPGTFVAGDLVFQPASRKLVAFDRETGEFRGERAANGYLTAGYLHGTDLIMGLFDYGSAHGVAVVPLSEFLGPTNPERTLLTSSIAPRPKVYDDYPELNFFNRSSVAVWQDSMLVGFGGAEDVVTYTLAGSPVDTTTIPFRLRTGSSKEAMSVFLKPGAPFNTLLKARSTLKALWRMPDGVFLLWHQDNWSEPFGTDEQVFGRAFLSILSADRRRACVDAEVPFPGSAWPRITAAGDTVYALDQVVPDGDSLGTYSVVRRYLLDTSGCEWLPTK